MDKKRKVILINGTNSNWYEQAIFITSKPENKIPKNLVLEAENIINDYLIKKYPKNITENYNKYSQNPPIPKKTKKYKKKKDTLAIMLNFGLILTLSTICYLIYLIYQ